MVRLRAIGECVIEVGSTRIGPEAERAFALLLVLTLQNGRPLGRHRLVDLLWPGTTEERARHNLRQALYKLRQLGAPVITESNQLRLDREAIVPDVLLHGELEGPPPPELLRADLPFGEFLAGYAPDFSAPFRTWVEEQRGVMHARLRRAALRLLLDERRRGNWGTVETLARKVLQLDPLNEEATLGLAEATALTGSKRAALAILDAFLAELGDRARDIRLPASVLRRRIAERLEPAATGRAAEACFVGRAESMAFLNEHFQRARAGDGHTVLVWGEPGIGKTRLLAEFAQMALLEGAQVPRIACQERDVERPLSLFVDAVPLLQALPGALGIAPESVEHLRRLTAHDPEVLEPSAATREAELLFAGVRRAIFDLVDAVASEAPLVLVCEDVHWLDAQSWRVLRELAATLPGRPVLLVLSSRLPHATAEPPARNVAGLVSHRLEPLTQAAALALFESLTEGVTAPTSFRDWCIHVAEGSPLYLQLVTDHWRHTGELRAPPSLHTLIQRRIQKLSDTNVRVLQACAVLNRNASFSRLEAVLGYRRSEILDSLARLEDAGLVVRRDLATPCKHELIAQSALGLLTDAIRHTLHACAAQTLEAELTQVRSASLLWDCAEQWHLAGDPGHAVSLIMSCAAHLLELGLAHEAVEAYDRAIPLCTSDEQRRHLLQRLADAARRSGQWTLVLSAAKSASLLAPPEQLVGDASCTLLELEARWRIGDDISDLLPLAS
ncbi:MAG TPA: AAA family ATPase, partial [Gemmatimonadaceae bacterium]|nr:AAA family ATPase [Gemmatimonadaceae bacterium]